MSIRTRIQTAALCVASFALGSSVAMASEFITLAAPESLEVREKVNEGSGTMSGAHSARIRANALIASLFLSEAGTETSVQPGQLKIAPIVVPVGVQTMDEQLRLCTNLNTINGHYELIGYAPLPKLEDADPVTGLIDLTFETNHKQTIGNRYGDNSFIGRSFIAAACAASQTSYYMPVSFSNQPDLLNITFEVANGTVQPMLHAVGTDGNVTETGVRMDCKATRRLTTGFDCEAGYLQMKSMTRTADYSGLMELRLNITNGRDVSSFVTRISVPLP